MYPDLVHASRVWEAQDHTDVGLFVIADQLECRRTAFAFVGHLAHADLVADYFDGLIALDCLPELLSLLYKLYVPILVKS